MGSTISYYLSSYSMQQMTDYMNDDFRSLSLGQKQRVLMANAIARKAKLIIMDEPFASVDCKATEKILQRLNIIKQYSAIVLVSHHEINQHIFDQIIEL